MHGEADFIKPDFDLRDRPQPFVRMKLRVLSRLLHLEKGTGSSDIAPLTVVIERSTVPHKHHDGTEGREYRLCYPRASRKRSTPPWNDPALPRAPSEPRFRGHDKGFNCLTAQNVPLAKFRVGRSARNASSYRGKHDKSIATSAVGQYRRQC